MRSRKKTDDARRVQALFAWGQAIAKATRNYYRATNLIALGEGERNAARVGWALAELALKASAERPGPALFNLSDRALEVVSFGERDREILMWLVDAARTIEGFQSMGVRA